MIKILVLIMFLVPTIINCKHKRENILEVKKKPKEILGVVLLLIVGSYLCDRFDNTVLGYLIALAATMMLYTSVFFQGITEKGINIFLGTSPILKFVKFDEINSIDLKENDKDELKVTIEAFGTAFVQVYNKETGMNMFKDN